MVMEAVALKAGDEDRKSAKEAERKQWRTTKNKDNFSNLEQYR